MMAFLAALIPAVVEAGVAVAAEAGMAVAAEAGMGAVAEAGMGAVAKGGAALAEASGLNFVAQQELMTAPEGMIESVELQAGRAFGLDMGGKEKGSVLNVEGEIKRSLFPQQTQEAETRRKEVEARLGK